MQENSDQSRVRVELERVQGKEENNDARDNKLKCRAGRSSDHGDADHLISENVNGYEGVTERMSLGGQLHVV